MLKLKVLEPTRTSTRYEFDYVIQDAGRRQSTNRAIETTKRFGFKAVNFKLRHSELWDSIYPLSFLTRKGGPLFGTDHKGATIEFEYPVLEKVAAFYANRAMNFGYNIEITSETYHRFFELPTSGCSLSFGGGKDSRMLLGLLRETGYKPEVYHSQAGVATDIPEAKITESVTGVLADRIMPTLMSLPSVFVFGSAIGSAAHQTPWQQYYDVASPHGLRETSLMLKSLGVEMNLSPPASVLPSNLIQKILHDRYPALCRYQRSVRKEAQNEKNLQVSLLKAYHNIDFRDDCSEPLFRSLLKKFVREQLRRPKYFGYRRHRELVHREMRSIIFSKLNEPIFAQCREVVPEDWQGEWIDYIHSYVYPDIDPAFLEIFQEYASLLPVDCSTPFRVSTS